VNLILELLLSALPEPVETLLTYVGAIAGVVMLVVAVVSSARLTWMTRRILRRSLRRPLRGGEETSLTAWMTLSDRDLETGIQELLRSQARPLDGPARPHDHPARGK
jgi:hypothetical protein